jgi:hypothetical protein
MNDDLHAEGVYKVKTQSWGFVETTNNFEQFYMRFAVLGMMDKDKLEAEPQPCPAGTASWSITVNSDDNAAWLISTVQYLGYDGDDLLGLDPNMENAFDFEGTEFLVTCKHEEYNDQVRAKWSVWRPTNFKPLTRDRLLALNDRYAHLVPKIKKQHADKEAEKSAKAAKTKANPAPPPSVPDGNNTTKPAPKDVTC